MSELRKECYECLNRDRCIGEYKSFYCMTNRKYNFNKHIDFSNGKDKTITSTYINVLYIKQRLAELENELLIGNYRNYLERYELIGRIRELKSLIYKFEEGKSESF